jgi:glycosyltransferase involved in cell wall biosynthesis
LDVEKKLAETRAEKLDVEKKLIETHAEKSDIEKKLAKTHAEKLDAEKKLAETHAEKLDVEKKLAETRAEKSDVEKKLEPLERELDRLNALLIMAQQLARRASKFPFSIYFRTKRKYRIILRSLRSGWVSATRSSGTADAQAPLIARRAPLDLRAPPIGNPALADLPPSSIQNTSPPGLATQTEPHPGGFKAESLTHLRVMKPPEFVKTDDLHYGDEPLLSAPAIHDAMRKQEKSTTRRRVILSFSHDHYAAVAGGTQLCVGIEEQEARANDFDYLHVHPLAPLQSLAPDSVADLPFLRLTLNGDVQGICTYNALRDATVQLRETGIEQFVIIHHLLGHAIESVSEIIQATGRRQCWFWLHDFFSICVSPHLLRNGVSFCGAPRSNSAGCGICAFGAAREPHQKRISSFFEENDVHIIAPSAFIADLWRDKARLRHATLSVKPHVEIEWMAAQSGAKPLNRPARVAFIGVPTLHKGWPHFRRLVEKYRQDNDYDFLYFGVHPVDLDIPHFSVNVSKDNKSAMTDALREAGVDIVLHISPTPESFSFTTLEALASGAFVVTNASSGNTARLIARMGRGLVLDHESDIDVAFDRGDILMLAMKAQEKRTIETSKVTFSQMTIPFLRLESE